MNHLILGIGGVGERVLANLRKTIVRDYPDGRGEPRRMRPNGTLGEPDVRIGFLYVDSSSTDFNNKEMWRVFGQSVELLATQKLFIKDGDLGAAVNNLTQDQAVNEWIGRHEKLKEKFRHTNGTDGAGQIRRYGRFLFSRSSAGFKNALIRELQRIQTGAESGSVALHLCCTLGGGTGSGTLIDVLCQFRRQFSDAIKHPVYVYMLATDKHCRANTGNFYANQYAALAELNALAMGDLHPHDVSGSGKRLADLKDVFQAAYLITETNRSGVVTTKEDQERMVAEYLYDRIVAFRDHIPPQFSKSWTYEDFSQYKGDDARGYRFGSIGVKTWSSPEPEIREKMGFSFAQSAARQSVYNHWARDFGYLAQERPFDVVAEVANYAFGTQWRMSNEQLTLREGFDLFTSSEPATNWDEEWSRVVRAEVNDAQSRYPNERAGWLSTIRDEVEIYFKSGFRTRGVEAYFQESAASVRDYAKAVRLSLERHFYDSWRRGSYSLSEAKRILEELLIVLDRRHQEAETLKGELDDVINRNYRFIENSLSEWQRIGFFSKLLCNKVNKALAVFQKKITRYCCDRTERRALDFMQVLLLEIKKEVNMMLGCATRMLQVLGDVNEALDKEVIQRCTDKGERNMGASVVSEYNAAQIEQVRRTLITDAAVQQNHAEAARKAIEDRLGPEKTLTSLHKFMANAGALRETLEEVAFPDAVANHEVLTANPAYPPVLNVKIVDRLKERFGNDHEALRRAVERFMEGAATAFELDRSQLQPSQVTGDMALPDMPQRRIAVFLPPSTQPNDPFYSQLSDLLRNSLPEVHVDLVPSTKEHEITVLAADFWMGLRFFRCVTELRSKHHKRFESNEEDFRMEVHIEDFDPPLADLLLDDSAKSGKRGEVMLLVGEKFLKCIRVIDRGGKREYCFVVTDTDGRMVESPERISDRAEDFGTLPLPALGRLERRIRERLRKLGKGDPELRLALTRTADEELKKIWESLDKNDTHPNYLKSLDLTEEAKRFINQTLQ